jgi:hypothetical protein
VAEQGTRRARSTRGVVRAICWLLAVSFFAGTILFFLLEYDVTAPPAKDPPGNDFVADTVAFFQSEQDRWPQELTANLLFGLGFLLLLPVGLMLRRALGPQDLRSAIGSSAFAVAGVVGVAGQLIYRGRQGGGHRPPALPVRVRPGADHQPESRPGHGRGLVAVAPDRITAAGRDGVHLLGRLALERGTLGRGWAYLSLAAAAVTLVGFLAALFQLDLLFELVVALGAGVLFPVWAITLAGRFEAAPDPADTPQRVR